MTQETELVQNLIEYGGIDIKISPKLDPKALLAAFNSLTSEAWVKLCYRQARIETDGTWFRIWDCEAFPLYEAQRTDPNYALGKFIDEFLNELPWEKYKDVVTLEHKYYYKFQEKWFLEERDSITQRLVATITGNYHYSQP